MIEFSLCQSFYTKISPQLAIHGLLIMPPKSPEEIIDELINNSKIYEEKATQEGQV